MFGPGWISKCNIFKRDRPQTGDGIFCAVWGAAMLGSVCNKSIRRSAAPAARCIGHDLGNGTHGTRDKNGVKNKCGKVARTHRAGNHVSTAEPQDQPHGAEHEENDHSREPPAPEFAQLPPTVHCLRYLRNGRGQQLHAERLYGPDRTKRFLCIAADGAISSSIAARRRTTRPIKTMGATTAERRGKQSRSIWGSDYE